MCVSIPSLLSTQDETYALSGREGVWATSVLVGRLEEFRHMHGQFLMLHFIEKELEILLYKIKTHTKPATLLHVCLLYAPCKRCDNHTCQLTTVWYLFH